VAASLPEQLLEQVELDARRRNLRRALRDRELHSPVEAFRELGRRLALEVYDGDLTPPGIVNYDLRDVSSRELLIQGLKLIPGRAGTFRVSSNHLDALILIRFDRDTLRIAWARDITAQDFFTFADPIGREWRLSAGVAETLGVDVTVEFRDAWDALKLQP
jgi:hypothetical protein